MNYHRIASIDAWNAEKQVLGALLLGSTDAWSVATDMLAPTDFSCTAHHRLYFTLVEEWVNAGGFPGILEIKRALRDRGFLGEDLGQVAGEDMTNLFESCADTSELSLRRCADIMILDKTRHAAGIKPERPSWAVSLADAIIAALRSLPVGEWLFYQKLRRAVITPENNAYGGAEIAFNTWLKMKRRDGLLVSKSENGRSLWSLAPVSLPSQDSRAEEWEEGIII